MKPRTPTPLRVNKPKALKSEPGHEGHAAIVEAIRLHRLDDLPAPNPASPNVVPKAKSSICNCA